MITITPKTKLEAIIKTHGYRGINIISHKDDGEDLYTVFSLVDLPEIIVEYIMDNYNATYGSTKVYKFYEHFPIGLEISNNRD